MGSPRRKFPGVQPPQPKRFLEKPRGARSMVVPASYSNLDSGQVGLRRSHLVVHLYNPLPLCREHFCLPWSGFMCESGWIKTVGVPFEDIKLSV